MDSKKITTLAISIAIIFVVTWLVKFPVPATSGAYVNAGDAVIYVVAFILGGPLGAIAAALGSALADLATGAVIYIVPTLIIKGLMALIAGLLTKKQEFIGYIMGIIIGEMLMVFGYVIYEIMIFGREYAIASLPYNFIQLVGSIIIAVALFGIVKRLSYTFNFRNIKPRRNLQ